VNIESLIPFVPLLYLVFALVQVLRRQRQGLVALILALLVLVAPIVVYFLSSGVATRLSFISSLAISAGIVFVVSVIIGWLDQRNTDRKQRSSYGIIGIVMSFVLAIFIVVMPMTQTAAAGFPGAGTQAANQARLSAVSQVLTAQTGLSAEELSTQLNGGSTIAALVEAHNGDLAKVTDALVTALDTLKAEGGVATRLLASAGSDSTDIASKLVQGQLPAQAQLLLTTRLVTNTAASQGNAAAAGNTSNAAGTAVPQTRNNGFQPAQTANVERALPTNTPAVPPTLAPTQTVVRPTPIVFPTATPFVEAASVTTDATNVAPADNTATSIPAVTCTLVVDFNLNLRDKPTTEGSTVLLSIPFGTTVTATGHSAEKWYSVSYDGKSGWVSGDYVTAQAACAQLPTIVP
jgi:uncharacterized protein YgiM (DUF1202 family)